MLLGLSVSATPVNIELLLLVDVSGSVDASEFATQRGGYVAAFQDPAVQALIEGNPGGIAAAFGYWSGASQQQLAVGWTHLENAADAIAFANAINATTRPYSGLTAVQSALAWGVPLFNNNGFEGNKLIIDISGDGVDNNSPAGLLPTGGRDAASMAGIIVNGLPIGGNAITNYYTNNVITGAGSFVLPVNGFADFETAVSRKIFVELGGEIPEPSTYAMIGVGLAALGFIRRRK
jgi:hypothetical protein